MALKPLLRVEGRHAAEARGGHRLPIAEVVDVTGRKDAVHGCGGRKPVVRPQDNVSFLQPQLVTEDIRRRLVADREEQPPDFQVFTLLIRTPSTRWSPRTSITSESQMTLMFGVLKSRSCMILLARNACRRWTTVTVLHSFAK